MNEDIGFDFRVAGVKHRGCGGSWVRGSVAGYRFEALVFAERAAGQDSELGGESGIAKLTVHRADGAEVYCWERGPVTVMHSDEVVSVVEFLSAGLADYVFGRLS